MGKILLILAFILAVFQKQVFGQIVPKEEHIDSNVLSQDCKLSEEQAGKIFTKLEVLADFRGGYENWLKYANNNFDFDYVTNKDTSGSFQDSIVLRFVVTRVGAICAIQVVKGNHLLEEPAIKLLKHSPDWRPGSNGGRLLNSYRTIRINIYIDKERHIRQIRPSANWYS